MNKRFFYRVMRFGLNGLLMTLGTYLLIRLFMFFSIGYIYSSITSSVIMIFVNYMTSTKFVFKSKRSRKSLVHFLISQGIAFLLFNLVNYILFISGLDKNYCFVIATVFSVAVNFIYNNFITFRK